MNRLAALALVGLLAVACDAAPAASTIPGFIGGADIRVVR